MNDAQDLTQSFFAELLEKNYVRTATRERGRFRAFLITAFKNYLSKQWEKAKAQKRGGGRALISLDFASAESILNLEPSAGITPDQLYDQQWTIALLGRVLDRLRKKYDDSRKAKQFEELKAFVIGDHQGTTYSEVAVKLEMTEVAAKKAASRMRLQYRELLRKEIAQTVSNLTDVDDEIRSLFATLKQ